MAATSHNKAHSAVNVIYCVSARPQILPQPLYYATLDLIKLPYYAPCPRLVLLPILHLNLDLDLDLNPNPGLPRLLAGVDLLLAGSPLMQDPAPPLCVVLLSGRCSCPRAS